MGAGRINTSSTILPPTLEAGESRSSRWSRMGWAKILEDLPEVAAPQISFDRQIATFKQATVIANSAPSTITKLMFSEFGKSKVPSWSVNP